MEIKPAANSMFYHLLSMYQSMSRSALTFEQKSITFIEGDIQGFSCSQQMLGTTSKVKAASKRSRIDQLSDLNDYRCSVFQFETCSHITASSQFISFTKRLSLLILAYIYLMFFCLRDKVSQTAVFDHRIIKTGIHRRYLFCSCVHPEI